MVVLLKLVKPLSTIQDTELKTQNPRPLKGQVWSLDFFAVSVTLTLILMLFIVTWNFMAVRWSNIQSYNELWSASLSATDALVITPGQPANWDDIQTLNDSNVVTFGLANSRNVIDNNKISKFVSFTQSNYSIVKSKLGLVRYNFFINISSMEKETTYYQIGSKGSPLNETVVFERLILLNGSIVNLRMEVWK